VETSEQQLVIRWKAKGEASYRLEKATNLDTDTWVRLDEVEIEIEEENATATLPAPIGREFFRIAASYE
jgi:hypothetical protein